MPPEVENRLTLLPRMSKAQLLALWKHLFRVPPPRQGRRDLLIKFLAHRMQEQAYGGLSPATRIKPGTGLIRDWRGQSHRVTVLTSTRQNAIQVSPKSLDCSHAREHMDAQPS